MTIKTQEELDIYSANVEIARLENEMRKRIVVVDTSTFEVVTNHVDLANELYADHYAEEDSSEWFMDDMLRIAAALS